MNRMENINLTFGKTIGLDFVDSFENTVKPYRNEQITYTLLVSVKTSGKRLISLHLC